MFYIKIKQHQKNPSKQKQQSKLGIEMRIMSLKPLDYFLYAIIQATENAITSGNQN